MAGNLNIDYINGKKVNHLTTGVRQTVQNSVVDANGYPIFATIGTGLSVNIAATAVPIIVHSAGGKIIDDVIAIISADTTLAVVTNTTNYGYVDTDMTTGVVTLGNTVLAPVYQFGGTPSIVAGQHTYNIAEGKMYVGNGSVATQVKRTFILEAVAGASTVTSVVNYALNGMYDSGYTATLPTVSTQVSKNHNIGTDPLITDFIITNTTTQGGYAVGDSLPLKALTSTDSGNNAYGWGFYSNKKVISLATHNTVAFYTLSSTGVATALTLASWKYKFIAKRGW